MSYQKTISPAFEQIGKRKRLTGYTAELYDGTLLLHSQEYSTNGQAEQALDRIVYDLLTDLAEQGLVDDVPAALEAEQVSSIHLPGWAHAVNDAPPGFPDDDDDSPDGGGPPRAIPAPSFYELMVAECQAELDTYVSIDYHTVSQSPFCAEPDNHCSVHNPCPAHAADAMRYLAQQSLTTWQPANILVGDLPF